MSECYLLSVDSLSSFVDVDPVSKPRPHSAERRRAFGERIRELRKPLGLSQEELGHRAGLDRTYIGSVERGERNISLDNIWALADTLGVHPRELF
ncbi:helix-turn-helix domain-containing protein [Pimelobacter simplex]|uniref:helix-turn-helix domain-containing protein n=1 Tax=Nocardioides simplex TaxID=2045 RepID=UPI003AB061CE